MSDPAPTAGAPPARSSKCWKMTAKGSPADPEVLKEETRAIPAVGPTEVLVKVNAAALNPIDYKLCQGKIAILATPPFVPGFDFAGVVEEPGAKSGFAKGQEVFGDVPNLKATKSTGGSLSSYILVPANKLALKPESLSAAEASSLCLVAVTVLDCMAKAAPAAASRVLVLGASGGVGTMAVQICKARGLTVIGVCSGKNREMVMGLGADEVIDYSTDDWSVKLADNKVEVVFDFAPSGPASVESWNKAKSVLRPKGRFITISGDDPEGKVTLGSVVGGLFKQMWRNSVSGFKYHSVLKEAGAKKLEEVSKLVQDGKLKPVVEKVYPWTEVHAAFAKLMSARAAGKIVVSVP